MKGTSFSSLKETKCFNKVDIIDREGNLKRDYLQKSKLKIEK